jgi:hypothetical protein
MICVIFGGHTNSSPRLFKLDRNIVFIYLGYEVSSFHFLLITSILLTGKISINGEARTGGGKACLCILLTLDFFPPYYHLPANL